MIGKKEKAHTREEIEKNIQTTPSAGVKGLIKDLEKAGGEVITCNDGFELKMQGGPTLHYIGNYRVVLVRNE